MTQCYFNSKLSPLRSFLTSVAMTLCFIYIMTKIRIRPASVNKLYLMRL